MLPHNNEKENRKLIFNSFFIFIKKKNDESISLAYRTPWLLICEQSDYAICQTNIQ